VLGQQVSQFGLQVTKKTAVTNENGETDVHMEEMTTSIDNGPVEDQPKSLEETALAALIRGKYSQFTGTLGVEQSNGLLTINTNRG
jgi:hypothetical protein